MKRFTKILSLTLVLLMAIPMFAMAPLDVNAESSVHKSFSNLIDFEDAEDGTLTDDYVQSKLAHGFSATSNISGLVKPELRENELWTVAEEQKHDGTNYVSAGNGNKVIRQTTAGSFPLFTIYDNTGILFDQPFEYSFDIYPRNSHSSNTGLIHFANSEAFASGNRVNVVGMGGKNIARGDGNFGTTLGTLTVNAWTSVRVWVYPDTGRVITFINGVQKDDAVLSGVKDLSASKDPTSAGLAIGWNFNINFDFDLDNISLCSLESAATVREHVDFTDAQIDTVPAVPETQTAQTLLAYLNANDKTLTSGITQFTDSAGTSCFELEKDGDNWIMSQDISSTATANATTAGLNFKDTTNLTNKDTVTITFDFRRNADKMPGGYNTVRTSGGTTMGPLTFRDGKYITTNANGYATFRKTDTGYVQGTIAKGVWYSFKVELDMANTKMKVWVKEGTADGPSASDWEPVYYLTNGTADGVAGGTIVTASTAISKTYALADFETIMTTDADLKWYNGSSAAFGATPQLWFLHGTNNAWGNGANADMDNLSIVTADGGLDVFFDFTPEITTTPAIPEIPANTDWWVNDSFQNADGKKGGTKLTDWQVVDAPSSSSAYGKVIQPKANLGSFCFEDTKDVLTDYVFDVSYDFYMTAQPSSNILMLKLWAPYTATDSVAEANNTVLNTLVLESGQFQIFDTLGSGSRRAMNIPVSASVNTWYNIRTRFDFTNGYYWVYINGRLVHTQDILEVYPNLNIEAFRSIHFGLHSYWGSSVKAYHYMDNIIVNTVDEPSAEDKTAEIVGVQQSKTSNSVRVIAGVDSLDYGNVGFTFELLAEDGTGWVKVYDKMTNTVYTQITADGETVNAEDEGCKYFIMAVISDIETDGILCVRPYTTRNYVRDYGEEAIYSLKVDDGSLLMQPTTIANTSSSSEYTVYKYEGYEEAAEAFTTYSATPSETDTGDYRLGGEMHSTSIPVGATTESARTGKKSMTISGIAPTSSNKLSARIKLNNLMPYDIANYENYDVKLSAYIKLNDVLDPSKAVSIRFGLMSENSNSETFYRTTSVYEDQWTLIEYEGRITEELLTALGEGYPARVFIGLGRVGNYASDIHVDDVKVEFKPSVGVSLPAIFADGMVLQRNKPVNVWGWNGLAGDSITATVADGNGTILATANTTVDQNGEFIVTLPKMSAASGCTLNVTNNTSGASIEYEDVGIGEVWFCSGQSNMQLSMARLHNVEDIVADANNRDIRAFKVNHVVSYEIQEDVKGSWKNVTSDNVGSVSGIGYVTAYQLQKTLDVPVAIIESYLGSSSANAWLSYRKMFAEDRAAIYNNEDWIPRNEDGSIYTASSGGLEGKTMYQDYEYYWQVGTANEGTVRDGEYGNKGNTFAPTGLYNGMQGPLANFALAGVMWYQGEARTNSLRAEEYNYILKDLIEQWREDFCDDELPVVIFQLAPYPASPYYHEIRQVQLDAAKRNEHVYAITTATEGAIYSQASGGSCLDLDRSNKTDGTQSGGNAIHPGTKVPVATRAANTLLVNEYGVTSYASLLNPEYQSMTVNGNMVTLTFSDANGLKIHSGDAALEGFRALDASGNELTVVSAVIDGDTVVVTTEAGTTPSVVTYGWWVSSTRREVNYPNIELNGTEYPTQYINVMEGNLENAAGQPAIPFYASVSDISIYDVSAEDGKLTVEIRELGHLCSTYRVVVDINGTATEYTADFTTAGNFVVDGVAVKSGDSVTVTLKSVDGQTVATETLTVE